MESRVDRRCELVGARQIHLIGLVVWRLGNRLRQQGTQVTEAARDAADLRGVLVVAVQAGVVTGCQAVASSDPIDLGFKLLRVGGDGLGQHQQAAAQSGAKGARNGWAAITTHAGETRALFVFALDAEFHRHTRRDPVFQTQAIALAFDVQILVEASAGGAQAVDRELAAANALQTGVEGARVVTDQLAVVQRHLPGALALAAQAEFAAVQAEVAACRSDPGTGFVVTLDQIEVQQHSATVIGPAVVLAKQASVRAKSPGYRCPGTDACSVGLDELGDFIISGMCRAKGGQQGQHQEFLLETK